MVLNVNLGRRNTMLEIFKFWRKSETVDDVLERTAIDFFNNPEVQEILKSQPNTNEILNQALKRQEERKKCLAKETGNIGKQ